MKCLSYENMYKCVSKYVHILTIKYLLGKTFNTDEMVIKTETNIIIIHKL
jgi:hypothetical protein